MLPINQLIKRRKRQDAAFAVLGVLCTAIGMLILAWLIYNLLYVGFSRIDGSFLTSRSSSKAIKAGILPAFVGSLLVIVTTMIVAIPLGIGAGVYLEEYAPRNRWTTMIEVNISNLASVPSIIYGLMGLGVLVYFFRLGHSILAASITLAMLILPIIIVSTREALRAIPTNMREAAYALGATKWQVVKDHLLPYGLGSIATGIIIAASRALGESAPLIVVGAVAVVPLPPSPIRGEAPFVNFEWLLSDFTVLPIQMFDWVSRPENPKNNFQSNAAAAGLILIGMTLTLNAAAMVIRARMRRKIKW